MRLRPPNSQGRAWLEGLTVHSDGSLRYKGRLVVPKKSKSKNRIMDEANRTRFSMHLGVQNMYQNLKSGFWWKGIKLDIAKCVSQCVVCQHVNVEYRKLGGLLQL